MKTIIGFIPILLLFSCNKFLDRPPLDSITDKEMSFNATEMKLYCNQFYPDFPGFTAGSYFSGYITEDNNSDNMIPGSYTYSGQISGTYIVPTSGGGWDWSRVRSANYFLANYHVTKETRADINTYVGEMYFWRAWSYFDLMKQFGDLPWYSTPLNTNDSIELYAPRLSRSIIADSILKDLDSAISLLNPYGKAEFLRINKDAALAFKSRVALYEGTWEKYHAGTPFGVENADVSKYFKQSAAAAEQVINSGKYNIPVGNDPLWNYWQVFNQTDLSNNPEIILWKKFDASQGLSYYTAAGMALQGGNTGLSKSLVDDYLCTDGKPIGISGLYKGDDSLGSVALNRDPRLRQTIFLPGYPREISNGDTIIRFVYPDITKSGDQVNTSGYQLFKGVNPDLEQHITGSGTIAGIVFRYAEILLNYAEAKAELGECTQQVLDNTINRLRARVVMPHLTVSVGYTDPNWNFPNLSPLLNEIRRERRIELVCEGFRFDDLMRWAAAALIQKPALGAKYQQFVGKPFNPPLENIPVSNDGYIFRYKNTPATNGWQFDPGKNYLKAIPTIELTLNPNLKQNPGY